MALDRRTSFGEDAELYDRARPGYPEELFDDLARSAGLRAGDRVLEVGCGTGQATLPLARRDYRVEAVELSGALAEVARRNLRGHPNVVVTVGAFEDVPSPAEPFDLVLAASAFHWVDPAVRYARAAEMLRPAGWIAIVHTHHVSGGTLEFFEESQSCYRSFFSRSADEFHLPRSEEVPLNDAQLEGSGRFGRAISRTYAWGVTYRTSEYLDLLRTYSDHRSLGPVRREELLACLGDLLNERFAGQVRKAHLTVVTMAPRLGRARGSAEDIGSP